MSSQTPNLMSTYGVNGFREPQSLENQDQLPMRHQQTPTLHILTSSSSSSSSGISTSSFQMPINLEQLALNDQHISDYPHLDPRITSNYNAPVCFDVAAASNERNSWKPLMAKGIAPVSNCSRLDIQHPKSNQPQKPKRIRTAFTDFQLAGLEDAFRKNNCFVSGARRDEVAKRLGLTSDNVRFWFQNKRMKLKGVKKESLKNSPLSRESCTCNISPSRTVPQGNHTEYTENVIPANSWTTQIASTSQECTSRAMTNIQFTTNSESEFCLNQNLEGQILQFEPLYASGYNEVQAPAVLSAQLATCIPSGWTDVNSFIMELQPHTQQNPP